MAVLLRLSALVFSALAVSLASSLVALEPELAVAARRASPRLTVSQLALDLRTGARTRQAPADLDPALKAAAEAKPVIAKNGCSLFESGVESKPCIYGAKSSRTSVVLFGDSHAAAWFPALDRISRQRHWRLVDFTKAACPPPEVGIQWFGTSYPECPQWRANALASIAEMRPALVVVTGSRYQPALVTPLPGVPTGRGDPWLDGLAATFAFLRQHARRVVFISDVPTMKKSVPNCVAHHMFNVTACTTPRQQAIFLPQIKAAELALARQQQIDSIDPTSWFCTPTTCPAIVANIILYRDNSHVTPQWSRFIAPVLAGALRPIMRGA